MAPSASTLLLRDRTHTHTHTHFYTAAAYFISHSLTHLLNHSTHTHTVPIYHEAMQEEIVIPVTVLTHRSPALADPAVY